jgi:hypothetical protein
MAFFKENGWRRTSWFGTSKQSFRIGQLLVGTTNFFFPRSQPSLIVYVVDMMLVSKLLWGVNGNFARRPRPYSSAPPNI